MVYFTGDIHGNPWGVRKFCKRMKLTAEDVLVLLGDVGVNYYGDERDDAVKTELAAVEPSLLCIHGNHEMRPWHIDGYEEMMWRGGRVLVQADHPNLLFAQDGEIFTLDSKKCIVIGGAYSVDKHYRLARGYGWWKDE